MFDVKFLFLFLGLCICNFTVSPPQPHFSARPAKFVNQINHVFPYNHIYGILLIVLLFCIVLLNLAQIIIKNTRYVTFDTCLNYLPTHLTAEKHDWNFLIYLCLVTSYFHLVNGPLMVSLSEDLHSIITHYTVELLFTLTSKKYARSYLSFVYCCKILITNVGTHIKLVFLCFFVTALLLSSDIETNPGPIPSGSRAAYGGFGEGFFSFCNWNINTLSKNDFYRVSLLEADNSIFKYDIISLCETSLNEVTVVPEDIIKGYCFFSSNHPSGDKKGGVGIFYKETLPLKIRHDLSFDECIVAELIFGRKKIFFTVLYRNPINKANTPEFVDFIQKFEGLY